MTSVSLAYSTLSGNTCMTYTIVFILLTTTWRSHDAILWYDLQFLYQVIQWRGNDFSTGWSRSTFSSWGSGGAVWPQRGPGQSSGGKRILTTIFGKLTKNQVSGSTAG